jgi:hypothetical protein
MTINSLTEWGTVADLLVAFGTLVLAGVAVFQDTIRGWFYSPEFKVSCRTEPPDCVAVPVTNTLTGEFIADSIYLRILVENDGNATAQSTEVYAKELRVQRLDGTWEIVSSFPPMNLVWTNLNGAAYTRILPGKSKHCDIGHIINPSHRDRLSGELPAFGLSPSQTVLAFELVSKPNNRTPIIGPGIYRLDIQIAAENARPKKLTVNLSFNGSWYSDSTRMLRDGVGINVES